MKRENKTLFENFLENKNVYNLNVGYWRKQLQKILSENIGPADQPLPNKDERGKSYYDANPIYSYYSTSKTKALRIIQEDPKELLVNQKMLPLDAWLDQLHLAREESELAVAELVVSIVLTPETVKRCLQLIGDWFQNKLNSENLEPYVQAANDYENLNFPYINRLSSKHIGEQPIRVLQYSLVEQFEKTNAGFIKLAQELISRDILKPGIKYVLNNESVTARIDGHYQTPYVNSEGEIHIHQTYLSYLWCISYSLWSLYDEAVAKPSQNLFAGREVNKINFMQIDTSLRLFKYALSLLAFYSEWGKDDLPNPEFYTADQIFYVEKSNAIFLQAINFILCHEFAHVELGHTQEDRNLLNNDGIITREKAADDRAIQLILQGVSTENKVTVHVGLMTGLCSMLFSRRMTKSIQHPNTDDRINHLLIMIDPDENDPVWGIAALALKLWDDQFQKLFNWYIENLVSYKQLYYFVKKQIEDENKL